MMPIPVQCGCGAGFQVQDEHAGKRARCPKCGETLQITAFVPRSPKPDADGPPPLPDRGQPFWKDPIVWIGTAIPLLIVAGFVGYLARQRSERIFRERCLEMASRAHRLVEGGSASPALAEYDALLAYVGNARIADAQVRATVETARKTRGKVFAQIQEARRQEAQEAEKRAADLRERDRLAAITVQVSGDAWADLKGGGLMQVRGMTIYRLPESVPRRDVSRILVATKEIVSRLKAIRDKAVWLDVGIPRVRLLELSAEATVTDSDIDAMMKLSPEEGIDCEALYHACHTALIGTERQKIAENPYWDEVVRRASIQQTDTRVDGAFTMKGVKGGRYYLYCRHRGEDAAFDWLVPLPVLTGDDVACDLKTKNMKTLAIGAGQDIDARIVSGVERAAAEAAAEAAREAARAKSAPQPSGATPPSEAPAAEKVARGPYSVRGESMLGDAAKQEKARKYLSAARVYREIISTYPGTAQAERAQVKLKRLGAKAESPGK